ncbi:MAG: heavy-metal-associated domain-containing protein [Bdellovibrionales bacterium]
MKSFVIITLFALSLSFPAMAKSVIDVNGMVCDFCAQALNKVFLKEDSVDRLDVSLDDQTVTIHYKDDAEPLDEEKIKEMIHWAGYDFVTLRDE